MKPLVSSSSVACHLRFLGAVRSFLFKLSSKHVYFNKDVHLSCTIHGLLFLRRSTHRLKLWITHILRPAYHSRGVSAGLKNTELPPFDVLWVLHSYMLHPHTFYEDILRLHPEIFVLQGFPLEQVASLISSSMEYFGKPDQATFWEETTGETFAPPLESTPSDMFLIDCPGCRQPFTVAWLSAFDDNAQLHTKCTTCGVAITDETLAIDIFLQDIARVVTGDGVGVASILKKDGTPDTVMSSRITSRIAFAIDYDHLAGLPLESSAELLQNLHHIIDSISSDTTSCYGHPSGFSIDIGEAALRQTRFASVMYHAGWTSPLFPIEAITIIEECIKRYECYLQLVMESDCSLGPTKEIDLVWHTHQLSPDYRNDLIGRFQRSLDHVDSAEPTALDDAYSCAETRWRNMFGSLYDGYFPTVKFIEGRLAGNTVNIDDNRTVSS